MYVQCTDGIGSTEYQGDFEAGGHFDLVNCLGPPTSFTCSKLTMQTRLRNLERQETTPHRTRTKNKENREEEGEEGEGSTYNGRGFPSDLPQLAQDACIPW
jgi:hypothetical protein